MNKLILILGSSGTGKSTIEKIVSDRLGYKRVISHTTRPMRQGEVAGETYHFINDVVFEIYKAQGSFLETTKYNNWNYGIIKHDIDLIRSDYIAVVEPDGYKQIVDNLGAENIVSILIKVDNKTKLLRALNREEAPNCKEVCRRFLADLELFEGIEDKVDFIVDNNGNLNDTFEEISYILGDIKARDELRNGR